jgi:thioredoxin-like negative regulator of GroEL
MASRIIVAIDAAEEVRDASDGLVEKTATDPGAPFAPDALARLAALKQDDRAAFEALRGQLKKAGAE